MSVCACLCTCVYDRVLYASESEGIRTYAHTYRDQSLLSSSSQGLLLNWKLIVLMRLASQRAPRMCLFPCLVLGLVQGLAVIHTCLFCWGFELKSSCLHSRRPYQLNYYPPFPLVDTDSVSHAMYTNMQPVIHCAWDVDISTPWLESLQEKGSAWLIINVLVMTEYSRKPHAWFLTVAEQIGLINVPSQNSRNKQLPGLQRLTERFQPFICKYLIGQSRKTKESHDSGKELLPTGVLLPGHSKLHELAYSATMSGFLWVLCC